MTARAIVAGVVRGRVAGQVIAAVGLAGLPHLANNTGMPLHHNRLCLPAARTQDRGGDKTVAVSESVGADFGVEEVNRLFDERAQDGFQGPGSPQRANRRKERLCLHRGERCRRCGAAWLACSVASGGRPLCWLHRNALRP